MLPPARPSRAEQLARCMRAALVHRSSSWLSSCGAVGRSAASAEVHARNSSATAGRQRSDGHTSRPRTGCSLVTSSHSSTPKLQGRQHDHRHEGRSGANSPFPLLRLSRQCARSCLARKQVSARVDVDGRAAVVAQQQLGRGVRKRACDIKLPPAEPSLEAAPPRTDSTAVEQRVLASRRALTG